MKYLPLILLSLLLSLSSFAAHDLESCLVEADVYADGQMAKIKMKRADSLKKCEEISDQLAPCLEEAEYVYTSSMKHCYELTGAEKDSCIREREFTRNIQIKECHRFYGYTAKDCKEKADSTFRSDERDVKSVHHRMTMACYKLF